MEPTAHVDTFVRDHLPPKSQWPKLVFGLPQLRYPKRLNCAAELLDEMVAGGHGGRTVIRTVAGGKVYSCTYRSLLDRANQIARVLTEDLELKPGNRVLLRAPNNPMLAACWLAVIKAGLVAVPTMPLLRATELKQIIDKARVGVALCDLRLKQEMQLASDSCRSLKRVLYFNDDAADSLEQMLAPKPTTFANVDTAADDPCLIAFTSGTTGRPKGTVHFHRDVLAMCDSFPRSCLKPNQNDIFCGTPPLAFTFGLGGLLCFPMRFGASTVLMERLSPEILLDTIDLCKATICFTAPTYYRLMASLIGKRRLKSLKKCVSAGEALPDATRQLFKAASGIEIIDGIGTTEMMHIFISHTPGRVRRGATGYAIPGYAAAVIDPAGKSCAPGVVGRLAVKGPTGCRYLADPRQKDYVVSSGSKRGWNLTGDAYKMDADGYFHFHSRTDDMIISAGYNIAGPEVEAALVQHPAVAECGVVGVPDAERGQIVRACVVLKSGYTGNQAMVDELQTFVKKTIASYKYPRSIRFLASLPRTETGKLQRFRLREAE